METYVFHVSLPGYGRVWRKIELSSSATLEELHMAIQHAFAFQNDHLYSFFMSGNAWDSATEYALPDDTMPFGMASVVGAGEDEEDEESAEDEPTEMPTGEEARAIFSELQSNPELREKLLQGMAAQLGLPPTMVQMIVGNLEELFEQASDQELDAILNMSADSQQAGFVDNLEAAGDVQTTTLASLDLQQGKPFLYLFDYGDEWHFNVKLHAINTEADRTLAYPRIVQSVGDAPEQYPDWDEEA